MIGIMFFALVIFWLILLRFVVNWIFRRLPKFPFKAYFSIVIYILLIPLPVIDGIIGGFQFRALCKEGAVLKIDAEKIKGKKITKIGTTGGYVYLSGTAIPIDVRHLSYQDATTGEEYASFSIYRGRSGWLLRTLGFANSNYDYCSPPNYGELDKQYQFVIVNELG